MVGIKVGGTCSGLDVGSIGAIAVWLGTEVSVPVAVALGDGIGDGVALTDCPHAINSSPIARKTPARKFFFHPCGFLFLFPHQNLNSKGFPVNLLYLFFY